MSSLNPECYADFFIKKATLSPFPFFLCPVTTGTINTHILNMTEFCEKPRRQFLQEPLLSCGLKFLSAISMTFSHMSKLRFVGVGISLFSSWKPNIFIHEYYQCFSIWNTQFWGEKSTLLQTLLLGMRRLQHLLSKPSVHFSVLSLFQSPLSFHFHICSSD